MADNDLKGLIPSANWGDDDRKEKFNAIIQQLKKQGISATYQRTAFYQDACYWRLKKDGKEGGLTWYRESGKECFVLSLFKLVDEHGVELPEFDYVKFSLFCAW